MSTPVVSVIIPAYNRANKIGAAISSALNQTFEDIEVIVVDDASEDDLGAALAAFNDERLLRINHDQNRGAAAARNTGVRAARGQWVAFLDSDDTWHLNKLETQVAWMARFDGKCKASCTGFTIQREAGSAPENRSLDAAGREFASLEDVAWGCTYSPGSTLLVDRGLFNRVGYQDETLRRLEDWDWLLRLTQVTDIGLVSEHLAAIHVSGIPDGGAVRESIDAIADRHLEKLRQTNKNAATALKAAIKIEKAAQYFRERKFFAAAWHTVGSLALKPFGNKAFAAVILPRIWRQLPDSKEP